MRPKSKFWLTALIALVAGTVAASEASHRGRFYWGHEVQAFHPCGSKKTYWVKGEKKTLQALRDRNEKLREERGKPYQPIYVEAIGSIDTKSKRDGFAANYDGLFHLRKVVRVSNAVPKRCAN